MSLQYYPEPIGPNTGHAYIANWLLDLITDPAGNQVHVTYQADTQTANGLTYPRDAELATVEYDSPGCDNAQTACTGAAWAPLMRAVFLATHTVARGPGSSCPANGSLRCDDPVDLTSSGGVTAPAVQSTLVLNDVQVQVRGSASSAWNTLRDYQFAYDQSAPTQVLDTISGLNESTAGKLTLTQLAGIGSDGASALPPRTFTYTQQTEYYEDELRVAQPSHPANCGPSWIIQSYNGISCLLWSQSYAGNSYYLSSVSNGLGASTTFSWKNARANRVSIVAGQSSVADPFYCDDPSIQPTFPCNITDDQAWSRIALTQRTDGLVRLTQAGQGGTQTSTPVTGTTSYSYLMALPGQACTPCGGGLYWRAYGESDYLDFYNGIFMGFYQAAPTSAPRREPAARACPGAPGASRAAAATSGAPPTSSISSRSRWPATGR